VGSEPFDSLAAVGGLSHEFDICLIDDDRSYPFAKQRIVIDYEKLNRPRAC
jgi:hypothetical protein